MGTFGIEATFTHRAVKGRKNSAPRCAGNLACLAGPAMAWLARLRFAFQEAAGQ
jgi:hypothetical protein